MTEKTDIEKHTQEQLKKNLGEATDQFNEFANQYSDLSGVKVKRQEDGKNILIPADEIEEPKETHEDSGFLGFAISIVLIFGIIFWFLYPKKTKQRKP